MQEVKNPKFSRSLKLDIALNDRLVVLCKHLGVNPNSYLLNKVGEAVSKDEVAYLASKSVNEMNKQLSDFMQMVESVTKEDSEA